MIFDRRRCTVSIAADPDDIDKIESYVSRLAERFIGTDADDVLCITPLGGLNEGFMTPSKVQYVAATGNLFEAGYEYRGAYQVMSAILKNSYLYPAIRMRGGAYGYSFAVSHITGNVAMATYRDPCLSESLAVFGGCGDYIRSLKITDSELDRAVIGTVGRLDRPLSPYLKVARSLSAFMSGVTYEDICNRRADVLSVTARDIASLADPIDVVLRQGHICVIGNEEKIADVASLFGSTVRLP